METVVVGLDVPPSRFESLRWAAEYCRVVGDEMVGVVAWRPAQAELPPDWYEKDIEEVFKQAEAAMNSVASGVPHRTDIRHGDPRAVLPQAARDDGAAAVVVGTSGNGGFHGLGLGNMAHHLSHALRMPLVVVPGAGGPLRGGGVVVGLDGSWSDLVTLQWAVELAGGVDGSVAAVYASDPVAVSYPHPRGSTVSERSEAVVRAQVAQVASGDVPVELLVEVDNPVTALTRVADDVDASMIVVGRKGVGHLRGVLLGRVPAQLPYHARRPVAIVPRPTMD